MSDDRYHQQYEIWLDQTRRQQHMYQARNGYTARRRLPSEKAIKKKPWHSLITGWSSDELGKTGYTPVLSNGYPPQQTLTRQGESH